jgi:hypothetical protein
VNASTDITAIRIRKPNEALLPERPCAGCFRVLTDDKSGRCEDCQEGVPSSRPGSLTEDQRWALIGPLMDQGFTGEGRWVARRELFASVTGGRVRSSDLGVLSAQDAEDILEHLRKISPRAEPAVAQVTEGESVMPPRMASYDPYAAHRCSCGHLQYADQKPGDKCRFCDCSDHRPAGAA